MDLMRSLEGWKLLCLVATGRTVCAHSGVAENMARPTGAVDALETLPDLESGDAVFGIGHVIGKSRRLGRPGQAERGSRSGHSY